MPWSRPWERWKVVTSHVVRRLNQDPDGPWGDQIVMPDQKSYSRSEQTENPELRHQRTARATSFMTALKPIENYFHQIQPGRMTLEDRAKGLFGVIDGYWAAIRNLNPDCFQNADDFVMLKTPGIFSLHQLCLSLMKDMYVGRREWVEEEFEHMLEPCTEISNPSFWSVGTDEGDRGDAARYGSMKGFKELGDLLYESLHG